MIFDWEDFWALAEKLAADAPSQPAPMQSAMQRTAISRAYYAVFGSAANWLRLNHPTQILARHGEIHQSVLDFFVFSSDGAIKKLAAPSNAYADAAISPITTPVSATPKPSSATRSSTPTAC